MGTSRRDFIKHSVAFGGMMSLGAIKPNLAMEREVTKAAKPLRILILGGTGFIGPAQVKYALARGHKLTLFNRGKTNPKLFPDVEHLEGDRNGKLDALKGREWDVVIDNPSTLPRWVRDAAQVLKDSVKQYVFISTISVYADTSKPIDENSALIKLEDPTVEKIAGETYGGLKALAEKEAEKAFPGRATIIRPGLIVGPGDFSDRFTYWPVRIDRGGEVLAPGNQDDPVQFIDTRDLSAWIIRMCEQSEFGTFNATGPKAPLSVSEMLYGIRAITDADVKFTWIDAAFLEAQQVRPWADLPVWLPGQGETAYFAKVDISRAVNKGLTFRPLADTARDTLEWYKSRPEAEQAKLRSGLAPQREAEVLAAWKARKK